MTTNTQHDVDTARTALDAAEAALADAKRNLTIAANARAYELAPFELGAVIAKDATRAFVVVHIRGVEAQRNERYRGRVVLVVREVLKTGQAAVKRLDLTESELAAYELAPADHAARVRFEAREALVHYSKFLDDQDPGRRVRDCLRALPGETTVGLAAMLDAPELVTCSNCAQAASYDRRIAARKAQA